MSRHVRILIILCQDVARAGRTCRKWQELSADDVLWRKIILRDFLIEDRSRLDSLDSLEATSWRAEYQRMVDNTPEICTEVDTVESLYVHWRKFFLHIGNWLIAILTIGSGRSH